LGGKSTFLPHCDCNYKQEELHWQYNVITDLLLIIRAFSLLLAFSIPHSACILIQSPRISLNLFQVMPGNKSCAMPAILL